MRSAKITLSVSGLRPQWTNPVIPGDHPDPTIIKVGDTFWASATSGEWSPQFPLFQSPDLVHWQPTGAIFPVQPSWASGSFWAPELVHDEVTGRFLVWYVGQKHGGPLSIAVATAEAPGGPYTDHGPLISEEDGSIDPCFARDEHGAPFLIWKEDGNSQGRPTPIWAQSLSEDLLRLAGEKICLITNDEPWEDGVVEGPYILRHEEWFFLFYAGNSCCGRECKYAEGVARAKSLLGPWEKFPGNPILDGNDRWRCPGHGTAVHVAGAAGGPVRDYLLYHAYPEGGTIFVGREAVLDEIQWPKPVKTAAGFDPGWPSINSNSGPGEWTSPQPIDFADNFESSELGSSWQWPVNTQPEIRIADRALELIIPRQTPDHLPSDKPVESALLAVPRPAAERYRATITLMLEQPSPPTLWAGLAIIGDPFNTVGLGRRGEQLILWERRGANQAVLWHAPVPVGRQVHLRSESVGTEHHLQFWFSDDEESWTAAGEPYDATDLPAWDRALRIGLMLEGPLGLSARFASFELLSR